MLLKKYKIARFKHYKVSLKRNSDCTKCTFESCHYLYKRGTGTITDTYAIFNIHIPSSMLFYYSCPHTLKFSLCY